MLYMMSSQRIIKQQQSMSHDGLSAALAAGSEAASQYNGVHSKAFPAAKENMAHVSQKSPAAKALNRQRPGVEKMRHTSILTNLN